MEKSDFKLIYNYIKNLEDVEIQNIINDIDNDSSPLKDSVEKLGKNKVLKTINKISDFIFADLNTSVGEEFSEINSENTSELIEEQNINTDELSETSVFLDDQNTQKELASEASQLGGSENEDSELFVPQNVDNSGEDFGNDIDTLNELILNLGENEINNEINNEDNNIDSIIDMI